VCGWIAASSTSLSSTPGERPRDDNHGRPERRYRDDDYRRKPRKSFLHELFD